MPTRVGYLEMAGRAIGSAGRLGVKELGQARDDGDRIEVEIGTVSSREVEDVLLTHPGVREVAVVGLPGKLLKRELREIALEH